VYVILQELQSSHPSDRQCLLHYNTSIQQSPPLNYLSNNLVALASVCDKLKQRKLWWQNLHVGPCLISVGHGLGLMSIWIITGKKTVLF